MFLRLSLHSYEYACNLKWRILIGAGLAILCNVGFDKSMSLAYLEILSTYEQSSVTTTSAIFSIKQFIQFVSGK